MNKLNVVSEGNNIITNDDENKKDNYYYSHKYIKENKNDDDIYYYYSEINKKNKQIIELKSIISNMKNNEEKLFSEVKSLQSYIPNSTKNNNLTKTQKRIEQEQILLEKIKKLQNENMKLRTRINKSEEKKNIFFNNINNKLLKAERDIQLLSFENKSNNNLILAIQNFLFNISNKINSKKQTLIFDLSIIDNNTFIHNLQILEANIINKINQLNNIGNMCLNNSRNYFKHNMNYTHDNNFDTYNNNNNRYTINEYNNNKIKNLKKVLKNKYEMKTINYLNSNNKKIQKKLSFKLFYNNFLDGEKNKDGKPLKAYKLSNNTFKGISGNGDICFENSNNKINNVSIENSKRNE